MKKKMILVIFRDFSNYNEKTKKSFEQKILMGYCPFCIVRLYCKEGLKERKIVLQYSHCIAEKEAWRVGFQLQYTGVYCNRGSWVRLGLCIAKQKKKNCIATVEQGQGWTVLQYSGQPSHDTAGAGQQARSQGRVGRVGRRRGAGLGVAGVAHGRRGARQAGRVAGGARSRQGARQAWRSAGKARGRDEQQAGTGARQARGRGE